MQGRLGNIPQFRTDFPCGDDPRVTGQILHESETQRGQEHALATWELCILRGRERASPGHNLAFPNEISRYEMRVIGRGRGRRRGTVALPIAGRFVGHKSSSMTVRFLLSHNHNRSRVKWWERNFGQKDNVATRRNQNQWIGDFFPTMPIDRKRNSSHNIVKYLKCRILNAKHKTPDSKSESFVTDPRKICVSLSRRRTLLMCLNT